MASRTAWIDQFLTYPQPTPGCTRCEPPQPHAALEHTVTTYKLQHRVQSSAGHCAQPLYSCQHNCSPV
ncbi:hypothetical protein C8Q77DRAFT_1092946 [Trametes polyzona]|nr:hypothetical protein C8Q77DRAFT_1092946 [Trametes polyzona]